MKTDSGSIQGCEGHDCFEILVQVHNKSVKRPVAKLRQDMVGVGSSRGAVSRAARGWAHKRLSLPGG